MLKVPWLLFGYYGSNSPNRANFVQKALKFLTERQQNRDGGHTTSLVGAVSETHSPPNAGRIRM